MKKTFIITITLLSIISGCSKGTPVQVKPGTPNTSIEVVEEVDSIPEIKVNKGCSLVVKKEDIEVSWVAFKTPSKIGVTGYFRDIGVENDLVGTSLENLFSSINFNIDSESVDLNDALKNTNMKEAFFRLMSNQYMFGSFDYLSDNNVNLNVNMNNVERIVPMDLTLTEKEIIGHGIIDVYDFALGDSLLGINTRCYDYHAGKTWSDVEIKFNVKYSVVCGSI